MKSRFGQLFQLRPRVKVEELSDAAVVAACATGDRTARGLLFERHVDAVHRFVSRMSASDPGEVDDLVQATFVSSFRNAGQFRDGSVRAWLFGIAANLTRDYARRVIRRKRILESVGSLDEPVDPLDPLDRHMLARLPEALASLPHDLRVAFVLVDLEQERGVDAALALGIPAGTLWRRLYDARRALRAALEGKEP